MNLVAHVSGLARYATGVATDATKATLSFIAKESEKHQSAVDKLAADHPDSRIVGDYVREWSAFRASLIPLAEDANSWTSAVREGTAENKKTELGVMLTKFKTLGAQLTLAQGEQKVRVLETVLEKAGKTPITKTDIARDHIVDTTTASRASVPTVVPDMGSGAGSVLVGIGVGAAALFALRALLRLFGV